MIDEEPHKTSYNTTRTDDIRILSHSPPPIVPLQLEYAVHALAAITDHRYSNFFQPNKDSRLRGGQKHG
ncbi:hypothetical protein RDI58_024341 [Solanum bulbocastanum]|uniref:Uncharacterized protein n=1 Tax=Solanum bulbocastanum TaxID=147425 RepID=A0AAN8T4R6_SOLBU